MRTFTFVGFQWVTTSDPKFQVITTEEADTDFSAGWREELLPACT